MTKQATQDPAAVPAGYETLRGNLPPFVLLEVGESIHGQIFRWRTAEKVEGAGKKARIKQKHYMDLTLIEGGEYNSGTVKKPSRRTFERGAQVTLNVSGDLFNALRKKVWAEQGLGADFWPGEDEEFPECKWPMLYGRGVFLKREADRTIKKGEFAGNAKKGWTVAIAKADSSKEAIISK